MRSDSTTDKSPCKEPDVLLIILKRKVFIDGVIYFVKDITKITCMIYSTKENKAYNEAIMHDVCDYGDKIVDYVKHKSKHCTDVLK